MKLEVGMYVRTKHHGILKYGDRFLFDDDILKASHNIIDLIEVGDYVNGGQVREIKKGYIRISGGKSLWEYLDNLKDIKSIVTKEQFESMQYRIGE